MFFNPNDLLLGDRLQIVTVILATGANAIIGASVGDMIEKTPIGQDPAVGVYVRGFVSTLVSGLLSCTLLLFLDRSKLVNCVVNNLNQYLTEGQTFQQRAVEFENLAAKVAGLDIGQFSAETEKFRIAADRIVSAADEEELSELLISIHTVNGWTMPWQGDFDIFMGDKNNQLVFE